MLESLGNKKIFVVVVQPDDELLGLGGTMNKLIEGFNVKAHVVILGEGVTSRSDSRKTKQWKEELIIHKQNVKDAQKAIGRHSVSLYNFPDNRFNTVSLLDIVRVVEKEKQIFMSNVVFTHYGGDLNNDYQRTFDTVMTACRPVKHETANSTITFEPPSGTEWRASTDPGHFLPNFFVSINEQNLFAKIKGREFYEFENRPFSHPRLSRALEILAQKWGVDMDKKYVEAFPIERSINE